MKAVLEKLSNKQDLTFEESKAAFEILMSGKASDDEIFNFLTLLSAKGEVSNEIAGGVYVPVSYTHLTLPTTPYV